MNETEIKRNNNIETEEDEMVVADMSFVRKRSIFLPERIRHERRLEGDNGTSNIDPLGRNVLSSSAGYQGTSTHSGSDLDMSPETAKWAILGTLKAALIIVGAYAVGLGALIFLMFLAFKHLA